MASISLTDPVAGTTVTAGLHAGNNAALRTAVNGGLDNTNIAGGAAIDLSKLAAVAWTAYTPTWTSAGTPPAILNGSLTGRYVQIGKTVFFAVQLTAGSTTTFGSANTWTVSLPVTAHASAVPFGWIRAVDASLATGYVGMATQNTTSNVALAWQNATAGTTGGFTSTTPFAWAVSDQVFVQGFYEAA